MPNDRTIPSPRNPDLVTFTIKIDGEEIPPTFQVLLIAVAREANRVPRAQIVVRDGDPSQATFPASNEEHFIPGKKVEILAGYHSEEKKIFEGVVVRHSLRVREGSNRLMVECRDAAFRLTIGRRNRFFEETTDSDAIETILSDYELEKSVTATAQQHQELVQFNCTDWDFIVSRADANGHLVIVEDGTVSVAPPDFNAGEILTVQYGATVLELDTEIDGLLQHKGVRSLSWDPAGQEIQQVDGSEPSYAGPGNLSPSDISDKLKQAVWEMRHSGRLSNEELQAWADAKLLHQHLAKVRGRVKFQGFADLKPGQFITLAGLGDRFNGKAFVSGVAHQISRGSWMTTAQLGFDEQWYAEQRDVSPPRAAHLLPPVNGLQIGVVTQLENDPEGEDRIKVRLPIVNADQEGLWARLACLEAGSSRGVFFRPEIGDEVIVGFLNDDPRDPVVLGALHSSAKATPEPIANDNHKKGYHSREGMKLVFDDEKKVITLETPAGNIFKLDEDNGGISLADQNGNKIVLDADGITIESAKALTLKAATDASLEGVNVDVSAQAALKAEGSATAELSAGGTTTVKGGLVQIN